MQFTSADLERVESTWQQFVPSSSLQKADPRRFRFDWRSEELETASLIDYRLAARVHSRAEPLEQLLVCRVEAPDARVWSGRESLDAQSVWMSDGTEVEAMGPLRSRSSRRVRSSGGRESSAADHRRRSPRAAHHRARAALRSRRPALGAHVRVPRPVLGCGRHGTAADRRARASCLDGDPLGVPDDVHGLAAASGTARRRACVRASSTRLHRCERPSRHHDRRCRGRVLHLYTGSAVRIPARSRHHAC